MFACALYPTNSDFLENVAAEVVDNVKRTQFHPALFVWSGTRLCWLSAVVSNKQYHHLGGMVDRRRCIRCFILSDLSGNNENEASIAEDWWGFPVGQEPQYASMYSQLYFGTVFSQIATIDTSRPVLASSPSNGDETAENPIAANPQVRRGLSTVVPH